ncbi:MAG TPA: Rap1a/Tai family immunity protein [Rhodospirillales bacterium]|nr:Rap1a/Tai family immunity protein [Rhodospirillales bacterium]
MTLVLIAADARGAEPASEAAINEALHLRTTQDLYTVCSVQPGQPLYERAVAFCIGFVTGVIQYNAELAKGPDFEPLVCPGRELARFEVVRQFLAWAPANPEHMSNTPVEGLARSAVAAWPCPKKS